MLICPQVVIASDQYPGRNWLQQPAGSTRVAFGFENGPIFQLKALGNPRTCLQGCGYTREAIPLGSPEEEVVNGMEVVYFAGDGSAIPSNFARDFLRIAMADTLGGAFAASLPITPRPFPAIFVGGLIVGALDLLYAIVVYSPRKPILVPQTIASGVLGLKSYSGGMQSAALGVVLHFVIALAAATVYYAASRKLDFLVQRAVLCGLPYGALVYLFMHWIVVPLSAAPKGNAALIYKVCEFVWHWIGVGLPIALSVRHYSR